ncbi:T9SS type A sorting domain-containing protein [Hymenobacter chitinivorans]|nr:T9SS type A sorting domain-containing protein [Hymenobacter chitinivorans]
MQHSLRFSKRLLGACLTTLLASYTTLAQTRPGFYSGFEAPVAANTYSVSGTGTGLCLGCLVTNPERAVDDNLDNYATIQNTLGAVGGGVSLKMNLTGIAPLGYRAGVVISTGSVLNVSTLATLTLRTYLGGVLQQELSGSDALISSTLLADNRYGVEFGATKAFNQVEIVVGGLLNGVNTVRVLYAYGVPGALQAQRGIGYLSRSAVPAAGDYAVTTSGGSPLALCVGTGVANPGNAVDKDLTNYATMTTEAGVNACSVALQVKLEGTAPAGYQAGFTVGNTSVVDLNVLNELQLTTYLDGVRQESRRGAELLQLTALPDQRYQVSFRSTKAFNRVELQQKALVSVLNTLHVYYGFGIEPRFFHDVTPVLSNFEAPQRGTEYQESASGLLCLGCGSTNPQKAADNVLAAGDYASVRFPLSALVTYRLKLRLNGAGGAGNRAGVVLRTNDGILNASVLQNIRLTTYAGSNGDQLVESASGTGLLDLGLINDNRHEVAFLTKRAFDWVEVELTGGLGLFSDARIYYAFAEDPNPAFPAIVGPALPPSEARTGRSSDISAVSAPLEVFPNPAAGAQRVQVGLAQLPAAGSTLQLYNMLGQMVRSVAAPERTVELPVTGLGSGLYRVVLVDTRGQHLASQTLVVGAR